MGNQLFNVTRFDRKKTKNVFEAVSNIVSVTLGPHGSSVLMPVDGGEDILSSKDGFTVLDQLFPANDYTRNLVRSSIKTSKDNMKSSGDGTTTAYIFFCKLYSHLVDIYEEYVIEKKECSSGEFTRILKNITNRVIDGLDMKKIGYEDLSKISEIALNNDPDLNKVMVEAISGFAESGVNTEDIIISLEKNYKSRKVECFFDKGFTLDRSIINVDLTKPVNFNARLLLTTDKITTDIAYNELYKLMEKQTERFKLTGEYLLIASVDIDMMMRNKMDMYYKERYLKTKNPVRECLLVEISNSPVPFTQTMQDLCLYTETAGLPLNSEADIDNLPPMAVYAERFKTVLRPYGFSTETVNKLGDLKEVLKNDIANAKEDKEVRIANARLACISSELATISVGANTDSEVKRLYSQYEDAVKAVNSAAKDGVVAGMCIATTKSTTEINTDKEIENKMVKAFGEASNFITHTLLDNAREDVDKICDTIKRNWVPFNIVSRKYDEFLLTPYISETSMIKSAVEIAIQFLISDIYIHQDEYAASNAIIETEKTTL